MRMKVFTTVLTVLAVSTPVLASEDEGCTKVPKEHWLSVEQLKAKLSEQGYTVNKIEIEDACAEAKIRDKDGKSAELYLDTDTGAVVKKDD
jgi:hypothetical protein